MRTILTTAYEMEQIAQIMKALALGAEYLYKDYNLVAKNSDWLIFVDAATSIKNFVNDWCNWIDEIVTGAVDLSRKTDPDERRASAKRFINTTTLTLHANWEGYKS